MDERTEFYLKELQAGNKPKATTPEEAAALIEAIVILAQLEDMPLVIATWDAYCAEVEAEEKESS